MFFVLKRSPEFLKTIHASIFGNFESMKNFVQKGNFPFDKAIFPVSMKNLFFTFFPVKDKNKFFNWIYFWLKD